MLHLILDACFVYVCILLRKHLYFFPLFYRCLSSVFPPFFQDLNFTLLFYRNLSICHYLLFTFRRKLHCLICLSQASNPSQNCQLTQYPSANLWQPTRANHCQPDRAIPRRLQGTRDPRRRCDSQKRNSFVRIPPSTSRRHSNAFAIRLLQSLSAPAPMTTA